MTVLTRWSTAHPPRADMAESRRGSSHGEVPPGDTAASSFASLRPARGVVTTPGQLGGGDGEADSPAVVNVPIGEGTSGLVIAVNASGGGSRWGRPRRDRTAAGRWSAGAALARGCR